MTFQEITSQISSVMWGWPMIILLLGTHLFLTIRLRFPQRYIGKAIKLSISKDEGSSNGDVSQFGALATSLAATIGTGNIIGVATAVSLGGPGAVLWCWLTGLFGISTKYAEGLLAVVFRQKTKDGEMAGGPMYALEKGLGMKWLAVLFCIFTMLASFGIGCTVQANSISTLMDGTIGVSPWITGAIVALLTGLVVIHGVKGISKVCSFLVPFMALFYVLGCFIILGMNFSVIGASLKLIIVSAFSAKAVGGGLAGGTVLLACRYGVARGLFSNESGLGSAPIVAAAAKTKNPVRQALVSSSATFWDTVVICFMTGLVIVSSILKHPDITYEGGAALTQIAFAKIPFVGTPVILMSIATFAFSTIIGWSYYAEKAVEYLFGKRGIMPFRIVFVAMVFVGSVAGLTTIWNIADIMNALMSIPNLISLIALSGVCVKVTKDYLWSGRLDDEYDPAPSEGDTV